MKNTSNNKNQNDEHVEHISFADFLIDLPMKYVLAFCAAVWIFAITVMFAYLELTK